MKIFHFNIGLLILLLAIVCLLPACSKFTEVDLPSSQLTSGSVFESKSTANAAMVDVYSKIRDNGLLTGSNSGLSNQLALYADEFQFYGPALAIQAKFFNNSLSATDAAIAELWESSYSQIYAANSVIEGVGKAVALAPADKQQLTGEALFIRALIHFNLVNTFGRVPYIKTTNYQENKTVSRMAEAEVYALVKSDLEQSVIFLPAAYIGAERVRANKWAAQALLARVCLYMQKWDEAVTASSAVLSQSELYKWPTDINGVFLKESLATIWQLMPKTGVENTYQGNIFIFLTGPPPSTAISASLFGAFAANDLRREQWLKRVTNGTSTWYHPYKYKEKSNTSSSKEYSVVLRIAEQYLIRSEARAHQGNLSEAKDDLDKVRNLAGLSNSVANTSEDIIEAVIQERRLELFTEFGHRFFDLKRTGKLDQVLSPVKPKWETSDRVLPIPQSEISLNPNLKPQNAGY
ncbi:RagB/SusD family nutrient uptake outer membrane protein [Pedobacter africanus]|uniref:SusD family protein n=1 Tax=Pedobacter africanus TaxID=151894 RepID=A0A1W2CUG0_9SPHI|nr:RagB/SusD family nutrient uptake outer membrane protein [Pedobacter africanus]SMC88877.1 SusD family protein [Pedobacter africanus]